MACLRGELTISSAADEVKKSFCIQMEMRGGVVNGENFWNGKLFHFDRRKTTIVQRAANTRSRNEFIYAVFQSECKKMKIMQEN